MSSAKILLYVNVLKYVALCSTTSCCCNPKKTLENIFDKKKMIVKIS